MVALLGLGLFVSCAIFVRDGTVGSVERRAFDAINGLPDALSPLMRGAQLLGVLAVGPLVALVALVLRRWRLAVGALVVTVAKLAAERAVWDVVSRSRPGTTIPGAIVRGDTPTVGVAFVSGHVMLVLHSPGSSRRTCAGGGASCRGWSSPRSRSRACTSAPTRRSTRSAARPSAWRSGR